MFQSLFSSTTTASAASPSTAGKENYEQEILLCPTNLADSCSRKAREILVDKWTLVPHADFVKEARAAQGETHDDDDEAEEVSSHSNSMIQQSTHEEHSLTVDTDNVSTTRLPPYSHPTSDADEIMQRQVTFYRRQRDWDLPRRVKIHWVRDTNV